MGGPSGTVDNTSYVLKHYMSANDAVSDMAKKVSLQEEILSMEEIV